MSEVEELRAQLTEARAENKTLGERMYQGGRASREEEVAKAQAEVKEARNEALVTANRLRRALRMLAKMRADMASLREVYESLLIERARRNENDNTQGRSANNAHEDAPNEADSRSGS